MGRAVVEILGCGKPRGAAQPLQRSSEQSRQAMENHAGRLAQSRRIRNTMLPSMICSALRARRMLRGAFLESTNKYYARVKALKIINARARKTLGVVAAFALFSPMGLECGIYVL